jgi:hypothetical protein
LHIVIVMTTVWRELGFTTKAKLADEIRTILIRNEFKEHLNVEDDSFMRLVFTHHPSWAEKTSVPVVRIRVARNTCFGKRQDLAFRLVREDSSDIDISWTKCLSQPKSVSRLNVHTAFREEVKNQIRMFSAENKLPDQCALCENELKATDEIHVDHTVTFQKLLEAFLKQENMVLSDVLIESNGSYTKRLTPSTLAKRWQDYHFQHAELRFVHARCNLQRPKFE